MAAAMSHMQRVDGVLVHALPVRARQHRHDGQQRAGHEHKAQHALPAHNFERQDVERRHEVVLEGDLARLHGLRAARGRIFCRTVAPS